MNKQTIDKWREEVEDAEDARELYDIGIRLCDELERQDELATLCRKCWRQDRKTGECTMGLKYRYPCPSFTFGAL